MANAYDTSEGNISVSVGALWHQSNFASSASGARSSPYGSFGFTVLGDVNKTGSLEVGYYFLNKQYYREYGGLSLVEQTKLSHITMGYRRWLNSRTSASLTLGTGYSMGEVQVVHSDFLPADLMETSARDTTEYSVDLAVQYEVWRHNENSIFLETRYSKSITAREGERADHGTVMLSWQVLLQDKDPRDNTNSEENESEFDEK